MEKPTSREGGWGQNHQLNYFLILNPYSKEFQILAINMHLYNKVIKKIFIKVIF